MVVPRLSIFFAKSLFNNYSFWFWSIFFMLFWASLGAYAFTKGLTKEYLINAGVPQNLLDQVWLSFSKQYTAGWLSTIVTVSFANTASGIVQTVYHSTIPMRFLSKFSRASHFSLLVSLILGSLIVFLVSTLILTSTSCLLFSHRFETLLIPDNMIGFFATSVLYGLTIFLLSLVLGLVIIVFRVPNLLSLTSNAPLIIGFGLSMLSVYVGAGPLSYSPFNSAMALIFFYFSGREMPYEQPLTAMSLSQDYIAYEPIRAWIAMSSWILILCLLSLVLLRKQRGASIEQIFVS